MKRGLMTLFGDQLRWFIRLNRKQRLCVLYLCLIFYLGISCAGRETISREQPSKPAILPTSLYSTTIRSFIIR